jgi:hypothetical protein
MSSLTLARLLLNNDDGRGGDSLILDQQCHHQRCLLRMALLKRRPALLWLRDLVDGNKKVDCQRLLDEVGEEVGTKEHSGGSWGGMNP